MKVMKFGGSSVKDAEKIQHVIDIARRAASSEPVVLVFSAMKGITDMLIDAATSAEKGDPAYRRLVEEIRSRQKEAIAALFSRKESESTAKEIDTLLDELSDILHGVELVRECSARTLDMVMSFGERINCRLIAEYLSVSGTPAQFVDARSMIVTDSSHGSAKVDFEATYPLIRQTLSGMEGIPVVTGFIARTEKGVTTTLGRNGSDYTASLIGAALDADRVEIWTDVDGVLSADPRLVQSAFVLPEISIEDAMELSYFGAEVIHPYTMIPAVDRNIAIYIKNTLNPAAPGTRIAAEAQGGSAPITGIASIENVSLINIEGGGMLGHPGVASRVFSALADASVNIIMISQASSEHSICMVCREKEASRAVAALKTELADELRYRMIQNIELVKELEIIAVVGENMRGTPGISGRLFSALGQAGINVLAIAQGSSERNISFVIHRDDRASALNVVHKAFLEDAE
ncbi:aspartate kinase [Marispirochaeta sp.]|uniref:aspartate kinase n=1 Tax=Marispirochaeta sp. TaxID=2038653 RepID=UPI0029C711D7|nr:aspartate kinase [Marispirochaeta sp.]